jgi:hypothetical protein
MPAVELSRLRIQINSLIAVFGDPVDLRRALRDLLDLYANRAYRPGQTVKAQSLLPSYRVTALVMRQLELELGKTCKEKPAEALGVVEELWHDAYLEPRLLSTVLLGAIPASHADGVALKIRAWATPEENARMLEALFRSGTVELRRSSPQILLKIIEEWAGSYRGELQAIGIRALVPLIEDPAFENLPPIFRLLGPVVQNIPTPAQTDLQIALEALVRRSPTETAYFLRQSLSMAVGQNTARLVRRVLPLFDPAQQAALRTAMQASSTTRS